MIDLQGAWIIGYFRENQLGNMNVGDAAEVVLEISSFSAAGYLIRGRPQPRSCVSVPSAP
jgi:multidrug resistance efflux pump